MTSTNVRRGGRVHFSGTVRPSEPGRGIAIQKRRDGRWITVAGHGHAAGRRRVRRSTARRPHPPRRPVPRVPRDRQRRDGAERRTDDPNQHAALTAREPPARVAGTTLSPARAAGVGSARQRLGGEAVRHRSTSTAGARWRSPATSASPSWGPGHAAEATRGAVGRGRPRARGDRDSAAQPAAAASDTAPARCRKVPRTTMRLIASHANVRTRFNVRTAAAVDAGPGYAVSMASLAGGTRRSPPGSSTTCGRPDRDVRQQPGARDHELAARVARREPRRPVAQLRDAEPAGRRPGAVSRGPAPQSTSSVTICHGRNVDDDRVAVDLRRAEVVLEQVRTPRAGERQAEADPRPGRGRRGPRRGAARARRESSARLTVSSTRPGASSTARPRPAGAPGPQRSGALNARASATTPGVLPAAARAGRARRRSGARPCRPRGSGRLRRAQQAEPQRVAVARSSRTCSRVSSATPKPCSDEVGEAVAGDLEAGEVVARGVVRRAARRRRTRSRTSPRRRARRAGRRP